MFKKHKYTTISTTEPEIATILSSNDGLVLCRDYSKDSSSLTIYNSTDDFKKHINEMIVTNVSDYVPVCFNDTPIQYKATDTYSKIRANLITFEEPDKKSRVLQDVKRMSPGTSLWRGKDVYFVSIDTGDALTAFGSRVVDAAQFYGKTSLVIVLQCDCNPVVYPNCVNIIYRKKDHMAIVAIIMALLANPKPSHEYRNSQLLLTNKLTF